MAYALAARIPSGKTEAVRRLFAESLGSRKAAYEDLQRRSGITDEAYWLQSDPEGDLLLVVSNRDQEAFTAIMAHPQTDFDRWFGDQLQEIFAFDPNTPGPSNDSSAAGRRSRSGRGPGRRAGLNSVGTPQASCDIACGQLPKPCRIS